MINEEVLNHDDIQKASEIIKTLEYQLQEYRTYKVTNNSNDLRVKSSKFELSSENGLKGSSTIIGNPLQFIMNSVAAVNAWFYAKGYVLSSELLTHAVKNKNSNSYYSPINGSKVTQSPVFKKLKSKPYRSTGTDYFSNSGTTSQRDLYYAIHKFRWERASSGYLIIRDYYDFEKGKYGGIQGVAVNAMYNAQKVGYLTPFNITISK